MSSFTSLPDSFDRTTRDLAEILALAGNRQYGVKIMASRSPSLRSRSSPTSSSYALSGQDRVLHLFDKFPFWVNEVIRWIDHHRRLRIVSTDMSERKDPPYRDSPAERPPSRSACSRTAAMLPTSEIGGSR